jgi:hypothetical protein
MKVLYTDGEGRSTILSKMAPVAIVPLHEHTALEQTYMLEGSPDDVEGSCGPRVISHGGRAATSTSRAPNGALLLVYSQAPTAARHRRAGALLAAQIRRAHRGIRPDLLRQPRGDDAAVD